MNNGEIPFERAILMLRRTLFPFIHDPYPWVEGIVFNIFLLCIFFTLSLTMFPLMTTDYLTYTTVYKLSISTSTGLVF